MRTLSLLGPRGRTQLYRLLSDRDVSCRRKAAEALADGFADISARRDDPADLDHLLAALDDTDSWVKRWSALGLSRYPTEPRATRALVERFQQHDLAVVAGAYLFFLKRGEPGTEPTLVEALLAFEDQTMATTYLNSGNAALEGGGQTWASQNNHAIDQSRAKAVGPPVWGSGR